MAFIRDVVLCCRLEMGYTVLKLYHGIAQDFLQ